VVLKKAEEQREKECHLCGRAEELLSQTLPVCLDCFRLGKESLKPLIERAHHHALRPFHLVNTPPRNASGISCQICINQCQIPEGEWEVSWYDDGLPWIASLHPEIAYALLAFHPEFCFKDLSTTSRGLAFRCKEVAEEEGLKRVRIGNLPSYAESHACVP
jgi:hypothetical protein